MNFLATLSHPREWDTGIHWYCTFQYTALYRKVVVPMKSYLGAKLVQNITLAISCETVKKKNCQITKLKVVAVKTYIIFAK